MSNQRGFTIVEILTAMIVGTIVMAAVYAVINLSQKSSAGIERRVAAQQDQKTALELMTMEIAMASFDPSRSVSWVNSTCNGPSANQAYKGIQEATANAIIVQMDIGGTPAGVGGGNGKIRDSVTGNVDTNEIIRYEYADNIYIRRSVNCGPALAFLGSSDSTERAVRVINNTLGIPLFRYYDQDGLQIPAPVTDQIPAIRRILVTLAVETENPDPNTAQRKRLVHSKSVMVKNHQPIF